MRTNRKTEEKKMSMSKNIARLAVTAGLTAALSFGGVMAPVTMAFAAGTDGSVTIKNVDGNATEFVGYQIFNADVDNDGNVSNITWVNPDVQSAVEGVIKKEETTYPGKTAQDAADWIKDHAKGTNETTRVDSNSVPYKIAAAVDGLTTTTVKTNKQKVDNLAHGYWLFVTDTSTIDAGEAGTSPIFTVVGSNPVDITEKTGIPTVEKKIVSDADGQEHDAADSQIGQDVTYNLYGTVAENFDKYDTYFYQFSDKISKGLTLQKGAKVYLYENRTDAKGDLARAKGTDITANFKEETPSEAAEDGSKTTTWTCDNLKMVGDVTEDSYIVVSYKAQINKDAVVAGTEGNENTVTLNYSNNPMTSTRGETQPDTVKDYTYGLKINKVDLGTEKALKDAKFTITTNGDEKSTNVKYVKEDGTLSNTEVVLSTGDDGVIRLTRLDAGVYTVTEVTPPSGYTAVNPFTFEIKPTMTDDGPNAGLTGLDGVLTTDQGGKVIAGITDGHAGDNNLTAKPDSKKDADGTFNITVGNTKQIGLPLTGLNGVTFTWIAGGAVLCIGVAHLIRSRKQAEESEQE